MVQLYLFLAAVLTVGVVWFWIVRPILVDFGMVSSVSAGDDPSVTSSAATPAAPNQSRISTAVPDTYQANHRAETTAAPPQIDISRTMSQRELAVLLALQRDTTGAWRWSANQIAAFVGGTRADVLRLVGEARGERPAVEEPDRLLRVRDASGERHIPWQDDPELAYQAPEM